MEFRPTSIEHMFALAFGESFVIATQTDNPQAMILREHELPQVGQIPPFTVHRALDVGCKGGFVWLWLWNIE